VLYLSGAEVKGNVSLNVEFRAEGQVNLVGAQLDGNLYCYGGEFVSKDETLHLIFTMPKSRARFF
jgi:hypothetical protein